MKNIIKPARTSGKYQAKLKHLLKDIIAIVFFTELANANKWIALYLEGILHNYLKLPNRIPSQTPYNEYTPIVFQHICTSLQQLELCHIHEHRRMMAYCPTSFMSGTHQFH